MKNRIFLPVLAVLVIAISASSVQARGHHFFKAHRANCIAPCAACEVAPCAPVAAPAPCAPICEPVCAPRCGFIACLKAKCAARCAVPVPCAPVCEPVVAPAPCAPVCEPVCA
ncbi:MAG: hypothetical protein Q4C95_11085, partial [Planctomycetia bacterium]|nr:hypothetical protein [Planctomycetia bacterium]